MTTTATPNAEPSFRHIAALLAGQLTIKPTAPPPSPPPRALISVANQPSPGRVTSLSAAPTRGGVALLPPPRGGSDAPLVTDRGEWRCFVEHLQRRGEVPGASGHDPERGVVSPRAVSVRQMLAFLRTPAPVDPACSATPASLPMAARVAPPSDGGGTDEPKSAGPVDAPPEPATLLRRVAQPERQDIALDVEESALDEALEQRAEIYQTNGQPSAASHEDEDDEPHQCFGTMPRFELAKYRTDRVKQANEALQDEGSETAQDVAERTRRLTIHLHETVRAYDPDDAPGEVATAPDQRALTKVFDGVSLPEQGPSVAAPDGERRDGSCSTAADAPGRGGDGMDGPEPEPAHQTSLPRQRSWLHGAYAPQRDARSSEASSRHDDANALLVQSPSHRNRQEAPPHADVAEGSTLWTDLGRDDEWPVLHTRSDETDVSPMQGLQTLDPGDSAARALRCEQELERVMERAEQLKDEMNAQFRLNQVGKEDTARTLRRGRELKHLLQKVQHLEDEWNACFSPDQAEKDDVGVYF